MEPASPSTGPDSPTPNHPTPTTRFLVGVGHFNRGEYFEAHEVWEDVWRDCPAADRRFYQGLIQAAVAVYHFQRNNHAGAARLFQSGKRYMEVYRPVHSGLDIDRFWTEVESHIAPALGRPSSGPPPVVTLLPAPADPS